MMIVCPACGAEVDVDERADLLLVDGVPLREILETERRALDFITAPPPRPEPIREETARKMRAFRPEE